MRRVPPANGWDGPPQINRMHAASIILILAMTHASLPSASASHHPALAGKHKVHRVYYASPIKGTHESLVRQNQRVQADDLERIQDAGQLEELKSNGSLVELPETQGVTVSGKLPEERRYCRPWTRSFLEDMAAKYYAEFKQVLQVTSAVRTAQFQAWLRRHNGNAADDDGEAASPHLTGATVDVAKHGMTRKQLTWARNYLLDLQNRGLLDAEEEFKQRVFHITVYKDYAAKMQAADSPADMQPE